MGSAGSVAILLAPYLIQSLVFALPGRSIMGVDIGGATTDVFSVFGGTFNRTVSANLGSRTADWLNDRLLHTTVAPAGMGTSRTPRSWTTSSPPTRWLDWVGYGIA